MGFTGRILAGHCCSLSLMDDDERKRTIDYVVAAGIAVVSLPMCNMYLQGRGDGTPRWRGTTAFQELAAAGVPVSIASDNTRDPFYAYGDLDMAEVWREGTRILHLDHPFDGWARTVARTPAAVLGCPEHGSLRQGGPADFILFRARSLSEWMARPQQDRTVVRQGRPIDGRGARLSRTRPPPGIATVSERYDIAALQKRLAGIKCETNPALVKQKSRDFFWYSPVLKRQLDHVSGDIVVTPLDTGEVLATLAAAHALGIPVTPRGAGHGQLRPGHAGQRRHRAQPRRDGRGAGRSGRGGCAASPAPSWPTSTGRRAAHSGQELRMHPSTYNTASIGGFVAGGSGGVGLHQLGRPARPRQHPEADRGHHGGLAAPARTDAAPTSPRWPTPMAPTASSPRSRCR